ncbi:hypothetical protein [Crossiella sp. NPDC003009]
MRVAAAGLAVLGLGATGCGPSAGSSSADAETLVVFTGQSGDYQGNFNPYSPNVNEGLGTFFEPQFFFNVMKRDAEPKRARVRFPTARRSGGRAASGSGDWPCVPSGQRPPPSPNRICSLTASARSIIKSFEATPSILIFRSRQLSISLEVDQLS